MTGIPAALPQTDKFISFNAEEKTARITERPFPKHCGGTDMAAPLSQTLSWTRALDVATWLRPALCTRLPSPHHHPRTDAWYGNEAAFLSGPIMVSINMAICKMCCGLQAASPDHVNCQNEGEAGVNTSTATSPTANQDSISRPLLLKVAH